MEHRTSIPLAEHKRLYAALRSLPEGILNASGRFLYSDISTLRPGRFYLLGYNPGGDPGKISTSLQDEIHNWGIDSVNAYLDEIWRHSPQAGGSPYQRNVQELCKAIGICPRKMCASNLFFVRSISALALKVNTVEVFWPIHQAVLDIVKPDCIFAVGLKTYKNIKQMIGFEEKRTFHSGHGAWLCYVSGGTYLNKQMKLIGFPHFSRYTLKKHILSQVANECSDTKEW